MGVTRLRPSDHAEFYRAWLSSGRHGEMSYLSRPDAVSRRTDPHVGWPEIRSAVIVALNYGAAEMGEASGTSAVEDPGVGIIARYARGRDYHKVVRGKLRVLLRRLEKEVGGRLPAARAYVDTGPLLERELARRAGLGWFGRNTMLIHPRRGSYFFLGCLLLELELEEDAPFEADHCGRCQACVDACPTGALLGRDANGAPVMDARRCISYLTIEHRGPIAADLRPLIGNRIYGCDICQEVCPFNQRFSRPTRVPDFASRPGMVSPSLIELMRMSNEEWDHFSRGSAIRRAGRAGFLRNVAIALGNQASIDAVPALVDALSDEEPLVRGHAAWALGRIGSSAALEALAGRLEKEQDRWVRQELQLAIRHRDRRDT